MSAEHELRCAWCGGGAWEEGTLEVREMMFGTRAAFTLLRCATCGSMALLDPPADPASQYPPGYYSLGSHSYFEAPDNPKRRALRAASSVLLRMPAPVADRVLARAPFALVPFRWFAGRGVRTSDEILDVGSGDGFLLKRLALLGFRRLLGVDPNLAEETASEAITLRRAGLSEVDGSFDVIMLHHVLEHLEDPVETLRQVRERLRPAGTVVARVPLADSWAARHYGANWVQLDAPRHLTVPTEAGFRRAAERAGLGLVRSFRDGSSMQYWGSEQYARDIPLNDDRSWMTNSASSPFTPRQVRRWGSLARGLNRTGLGDSGCFVLTAR